MLQQDFCKEQATNFFVGYAPMTGIPNTPDEAGLWMKKGREKRGWSTTKLADVARAIARREGSSIALKQQSISDFEQLGKKRKPDWLRFIQMAFEEGEPPQSQDQEKREELVYVRQVDIRYAMGSGSAIDEYPETSLVPFNLGFLQSVTRAGTNSLFLASGHGNSMEPTLLKDDLILIDTTEKKLGLGDLVWALEYAGSGYIKRLRPVKRDGKTRILILSDNKDVPSEEADPEDITIIGKVVWVGRRM